MEWIFALIVAAIAVGALFIWAQKHDAAQGGHEGSSHQAARQARAIEAIKGGMDESVPVPVSTGSTGDIVLTRIPSQNPSSHRAVPPPQLQPPTRLEHLTWIGQGQHIPVGDLKIDRPLTYFVDSRHSRVHDEPAAIDLALPTLASAHKPVERELSYWPTYTGLTPGQRRLYLEWLVEGRRVVPVELGYTFLFIYGLERRALLDCADQKLIFDEVMRLRQLYAGADPPSRSFDSYTTNFLCFLALLASQNIALKRIRRLLGSTSHWSEDNLAAILAWFTVTDTRLPAWAAFCVARGLPQSQRSIVVSRVGGEFEKLFCRRFTDQFQDGMALSVAKRPRKYTYRPASAALSPASFNAPNPSGMTKQFQPLSAIWNGCIQELRKLSSVVNKSTGEVTFAAWEAMPPELRAGIDHPLAGPFCRLIEAHMHQNGMAVIEAAKVAAVLEMNCIARLTPAQARKLCQRAADIGYTLEPDARLTNKGYTAGEPVAVFLRLSDHPPDPVRYNAAACMLRIALTVAMADGAPDSEAGSGILQHVQSAFDLNEDERRRLEAIKELIGDHTPDLTGLSRLTKLLDSTQRAVIGKLAIALAAADGVVTPGELKAVRKCYTLLGFQKHEADAVLKALTAPDVIADEPVSVQSAGPAVAGESIPKPPVAEQVVSRTSTKPEGGLRLNKVAIAAIMKDTQEVAQLLAAAMGTETDEPTADRDLRQTACTGPIVTAPTVVSTPDVSLSQRYAAFYEELISRADSTLKEAESLARQHGHMLSGAVESINDWGFERYGGQLFIEEGDRLLLDRELLN